MNIESKFYTETQNNSGGYYLINDEVAEHIIIEAFTPDQANSILKDIVADHSEFCKCCGSRWNIYFNDFDGKPEPMIYDSLIKDIKKESVIIYYLDGTIKKFNYKDIK